MSDDPKLNSPDRYVKRSPRLVLEEHSHCEVPAGCGGVVLRWVNPDREVPVHVRLYAHLPGAVLTIDGARPASSRPLLPRGDHVLALKAKAERGVGVFIASARFEEKTYDRKVSRLTGLVFSCDSRADGGWVATTVAPPDGRWRDDPYDDSAWTPLIEVPIPRPAQGDGRSWHIEELLRAGAVALGLPDAEGDVWVRRRFRIPLVGEEGGGT